MLLLLPLFRAYFSLQLCSFCWWGHKNIFGSRAQGTLATPLITPYRVPLLCHNGFAPVTADS